MFAVYLFFAIGIVATIFLALPTLLIGVNFIRVEFSVFAQEFKTMLEIRKKKVEVKKNLKLAELEAKKDKDMVIQKEVEKDLEEIVVE